jgi:hypothetical protein
MNYNLIEIDGEKRIDVFNENWYKVDEDTYYPSVTFIQSIVTEPELANWYKEVGLQSNVISETAKEIGSYFHGMIENFLRTGKIDFDDCNQRMEIWRRVCNFMNFYDKHLIGHEILGIEKTVFSHDWHYAGTVDLITKNDLGIHIWDWKSSKAVYKHHKSQVSAYAMTFDEVATANVVIFPEFPTTKQGYSLTTLTPDLIDHYFGLFQWLKAGFEMDYKEPKFKSYPYSFSLYDDK